MSLRAAIGHAVLRAAGWRAVSPDLRGHPHLVVAGAPHTSAWDVPIFIATAWELGLELRWVGKAPLFKGPFGWFFRYLGGIPVERTSSQDAVRTLAGLFREHERLHIVMGPEGTRRRTDGWRTGFYHLARAADVPIAIGVLDFGRREARIALVLKPTGDLEGDMARIAQVFEGVRACHPDRFGPVRPLSKADPRPAP